jgi:hypothetical protein
VIARAHEDVALIGGEETGVYDTVRINAIRLVLGQWCRGIGHGQGMCLLKLSEDILLLVRKTSLIGK